MNKHRARELIERLAARWPRLDVQVTSVRDDGYALALTLPGRYNYRRLTLARESEFEGILGLCIALLGEGEPEVAALEAKQAAPRARVTWLSPEDIEAIRKSYGPYVPGHVGKRSLRGNPKPSIARLAFHYHVNRKRIVRILQGDETEDEQQKGEQPDATHT
jgi:hypothetical protein